MNLGEPFKIVIYKNRLLYLESHDKGSIPSRNVLFVSKFGPISEKNVAASTAPVFRQSATPPSAEHQRSYYRCLPRGKCLKRKRYSEINECTERTNYNSVNLRSTFVLFSGFNHGQNSIWGSSASIREMMDALEKKLKVTIRLRPSE